MIIKFLSIIILVKIYTNKDSFAFNIFNLKQDVPAMLRFADLLCILFEGGSDGNLFVFGYFANHALDHVVAELVLGKRYKPAL